MDPTVSGAIIGAVGSVSGAVIGTILGYALANRSAYLSVFANYRVDMYYLKGLYCIYLPITVANEGNKGGIVYDLQVRIKAHNGQCWDFGWSCFSKEDPRADYQWIDGDRPAPILIHGSSATQTTVKFIASGDSLDGVSNVVFTQGRYELRLAYRERQGARPKSQTYSFVVDERARSELEKRRLDSENNQTLIFGLLEGQKG